MNITENLIRISKAKDDIKQSLRDKGIAIPEDALLDEYSSIIDETEVSGPTYKNLYDMRTNNGTNMAGLFARATGELDLRQLDTSKVTSMKYMFDNSSASVNIDGWDTKNVTDMSYMFYYFSGSIDISKLDTSSVTNANNMFQYAKTDNIILTGLSFPSTTKLNSMFDNVTGATLDLSSWDISNITNMSYMFNNAKYKRIDLTGWKTTSVTNMYDMFYGYSNPIEELIIPDWDMTNVTNSSSFMSSSSITKLRLIDLSRSNDTTITKIASYLPTRTTTTFGDVIVPSNTSQAAYDALIAKYWRPLGVDLTPAPTSVEIVAELDDIRPGQSTRVCIGVGDPWNADPSKVEIIMVSDESIATMDGDRITSKGVIGDIVLEARVIDTQEVVGTKTIIVSEEDLSPNVIKFRANRISTASYDNNLTVNNSSVYGNDSKLVYDKHLDLYSYDAGVPITSLKFNSSCCKLTEIVKLNTCNMTTMEKMFSGQEYIITLDTLAWDTSNVTNMVDMFLQCKSLTTLDLSDWDTSQVTNMDWMFGICHSLTSLDMSNCDVSKVRDVRDMFKECSSLTHFKAPQNINIDSGVGNNTLDLSYSPLLTHESLMSVINNLVVVTKTRNLKLGAENLAKLSEEEIAIATNKGWTVS